MLQSNPHPLGFSCIIRPLYQGRFGPWFKVGLVYQGDEWAIPVGLGFLKSHSEVLSGLGVLDFRLGKLPLKKFKLSDIEIAQYLAIFPSVSLHCVY
jgi:hypothetical protein